MKGEFTGKHMAVTIVSGFAIIITINLFMATLAVRGFGGVVVQNSYVASQEFNGWLEAAEQQEALGWTAEISRSDNYHLVVETTAVPDGSTVVATARRPLGKPETMRLRFIEATPGNHVSLDPLKAGRWIVRLTITSPDKLTWSMEEHLQ
jgi:nitrogen fixation protein FixH